MLRFGSRIGIQITSLGLLCLVPLLASAQESNLQKWKNLDGREIEGQFQGADLEKGTVTILVPKVIPFKLLTKESVEMAKTLMKTKSQPSSDASDSSVWFNESYKTEIYRLDNDRWAEREIESGKVVWELKQLKKTDSFVELYNDVRKQTWRLHSDRSELKEGDGWKWLAKGYWKGPSRNGNVKGTSPIRSDDLPNDIESNSGLNGGSSILQWRRASKEDRLGLCKAFITVGRERNMFNPELHSALKITGDVTILAETLMVFIDDASKPRSDSEDEKEIANKTVAEFATLGAAAMKWFK